MRRTRAAERGQSLTSLLVGLTVGLIVLGALFGIFLSLKTSDRSQRQLARLAATELRLMDRLAQVVQTAGFYPHIEYLGIPRAKFGPAAQWTQGQALGGEDGSGATGSILRTRFRVNTYSQVRDCGGGRPYAPGAAAMYVQTLRVNATGTLECVLETESGMRQQVYVLAESVSRFVVRYGTDEDADGNVDQYLDAATLGRLGAWPRVVTVRFDIALAQGLPEGEAPQLLTQITRVMNRE